MLIVTLACLALIGVVVARFARPVTAPLSLETAEKWLAALVLFLLGLFLGAWAIFVSKLPLSLTWAVPAAAVTCGLALHRPLRQLWHDAALRALLGWQLVISAWCVGWLALVATYSGGGWTGDWYEHWERARFFVEGGPLDTMFIGHAALTARPPLANVVTAAGLALTQVAFAPYQFLSTLLASLAFAPAALLAWRWGGRRAVPVLALLFMVSPLFVQNATFAWTKLPAACFVLAALVFFLRAWDSERPVAPAALFAASLAAGILTHYSAGIAGLVMAAAWIGRAWTRRADRAWWQATAAGVLVGATVLATWFGWAISAFGSKGTFLANTSVQASAANPDQQILRIGLNLHDTLVPHFLRPLDESLITQTNFWGALRDWWFQLYQVNLLFAFGLLGWLVLGAILLNAARRAAPSVRSGWSAAIGASVLLGVGVHGARDTWGLAHICLQPLVLLGLALLAARWDSLARRWRIVLVAGAVFDLVFGLALHFAVQNLAFERWAGPHGFVRWQNHNTEGAVMNMAAKLQHHLQFFGDTAPPPGSIALALLALLIGAVWRTTRRHLP